MRQRFEVPYFVFNYGFLCGEGDEATLAVQTAKQVGTNMLFAHVVPKKVSWWWATALRSFWKISAGLATRSCVSIATEGLRSLLFSKRLGD